MNDACPSLHHLMIGVPAYAPPVPEHQHGILEAVMGLLHNGIHVDVRDGIGCCYIDLVRNDLVRQFLESDAERLLFIDADVGFSAEAVLAVATTPRPVVGGLYRKRTDSVEWPVAFHGQDIVQDNETGLISAAEGGTFVPTGFLCIHRSVFEALQPHVPVFTDDRGVTMHAFFQTMVKDGLFWGEDFLFCQRWHEIGGRVWVHPDIDLTHVGAYRWTGNYHQWFQQREAWEKIPGFNNCPNLYRQAVDGASAGAHFVEVGAFKGKSAAYMAELIQASRKDITFDVVDHWEGSPDIIATDPDVVNGTLEQAFHRNVAYIRDVIGAVHTGKSTEVATLYDDDALDFVFIDASHDTTSVIADCTAWWPKVKAGGTLAGDDWSWESVQAGVVAFFEFLPGEYQLEMVDEGWVVRKPEGG